MSAGNDGSRVERREGGRTSTTCSYVRTSVASVRKINSTSRSRTAFELRRRASWWARSNLSVVVRLKLAKSCKVESVRRPEVSRKPHGTTREGRTSFHSW